MHLQSRPIGAHVTLKPDMADQTEVPMTGRIVTSIPHMLQGSGAGDMKLAFLSRTPHRLRAYDRLSSGSVPISVNQVNLVHTKPQQTKAVT